MRTASDPLGALRERLAVLESQGLLRERRAPATGAAIDVSSNDYLGYGRRIVSRETNAPAGAGASRLVTGTLPCHHALEQTLADWVRLPESLAFSSGYAANVGTLSTIAGPGDLIVSDQLNHASIVDGCRLSRARIAVVPHLGLDAIDRALRASEHARTRWVVTESVFSMDGDSPDLPTLRKLCDAHGAGLYVDEAHALGIFGPEGAGLCAASGVIPDVLVGALGKAVGAQGAFVAGAPALIHSLWNFARSFVFSTAVSPLLAEAALENVRAVRADDAARRRLELVCRRFRALLDAASGPCTGPIFPVVLGTADRAKQAVEILGQHGFLAVAIRPPTVPEGTSRLRISLSADITDSDLTRLADAVRQCRAS